MLIHANRAIIHQEIAQIINSWYLIIGNQRELMRELETEREQERRGRIGIRKKEGSTDRH